MMVVDSLLMMWWWLSRAPLCRAELLPVFPTLMIHNIGLVFIGACTRWNMIGLAQEFDDIFGNNEMFHQKTGTFGNRKIQDFIFAGFRKSC